MSLVKGGKEKPGFRRAVLHHHRQTGANQSCQQTHDEGDGYHFGCRVLVALQHLLFHDCSLRGAEAPRLVQQCWHGLAEVLSYIVEVIQLVRNE